MKLYCYEYHITINGCGKFSSYELEVKETPQYYIAYKYGRGFPDHSERLKKRDMERIFPYGFNRNEYYLVSESPRKDDIFRVNVLDRLTKRIDELKKETEKIQNAIKREEY